MKKLTLRRPLVWTPFQEQQQQFGEPTPGNWGGTQTDDFPNGIAGDLGWTSSVTGAAAANTALSTVSALAIACKFAGGVISTVGSTAAGIAANELTNFLIPIGVLGVDIEYRMALDTILSNPTNTFRMCFGLFDSVGAVTTGNFIGVEYTGTAAAGAQNFRLAYGTLAAPTYVDTGIGLTNLDYAYNIRFQLNQLGNSAVVFVNNQVGNPVNFPSGSGAAITTLMTAGWPGFKMIATVGTTGTARMVTDSFAYAIIGRTQN